MKPIIYSAEVLDNTNVSDSQYKQSGTGLLVRFSPNPGRPGEYLNVVAYPLNPYSYAIPLIGEHIMLYRGLSAGSSTAGKVQNTYYYGDILPVNKSLFQNANPGTVDSEIKDNSIQTNDYLNNSGTPSQNKIEPPKLGNTFTATTTSQLALQPFEGDYIIQGRYGQSIRLGGSFKGGGSVYNRLPEYKGPDNSPIIIIRTPPLSEKNKTYGIESANNDAASIYLTSNQKVFGFQPSNNFPKGVTAFNQWTQPQIAITSDRLIFNAKTDHVLIIGKQDVSICTPNWAVKMNEFFNIVKELLSTLNNQATGNPAYQLQTSQAPTLGAVNKALYSSLVTRLNAMTQ